MFVTVFNKIRSLHQKGNQLRYWTAILLSLFSWHAFHGETFSVKEAVCWFTSGVQSVSHTLSNTPAFTATRHCKVPFNSWKTLILKPKTLGGNSFMRFSLCYIWCVTCRNSACSGRTGFRLLGFLTQLTMGTFLTYASPAFSLSSGVWLASVSQWARNQRVFPEAGAAGHPGPTVPGPVELEPRVQRGSATTLSKSSQRYFPSFHEHRETSRGQHDFSDPRPPEGNQICSQRWKGARRKIHRVWIKGGSFLLCFILAWHWILTRTWVSKLIPSFGEISKFFKKIQSMWKTLGDYTIKSF